MKAVCNELARRLNLQLGAAIAPSAESACTAEAKHDENTAPVKACDDAMGPLADRVSYSAYHVSCHGEIVLSAGPGQRTLLQLNPSVPGRL